MVFPSGLGFAYPLWRPKPGALSPGHPSLPLARMSLSCIPVLAAKTVVLWAIEFLPLAFCFHISWGALEGSAWSQSFALHRGPDGSEQSVRMAGSTACGQSKDCSPPVGSSGPQVLPEVGLARVRAGGQVEKPWVVDAQPGLDSLGTE